jgi:hypothetical protein
MVITYSHTTRFPSRRVYRVNGTDKESQAEAKIFVERFLAYTIVDTRGKIKIILV